MESYEVLTPSQSSTCSRWPRPLNGEVACRFNRETEHRTAEWLRYVLLSVPFSSAVLCPPVTRERADGHLLYTDGG